MKVYVIKSWRCGQRPVDDEGHYVHIVGRRRGLLSRWLFQHRLAPTVRLAIGIERLELTQSSLWGHWGTLVPLENIASSYYGHERPWGMVLAIALLFGLVAAPLMVEHSNQLLGVGVALLGLLFAAGYGLMARTLVLGFVTTGGQVCRLRFRKSVIDGTEIDENQARLVCKLVQRVLEARQRRLVTPLPTESRRFA